MSSLRFARLGATAVLSLLALVTACSSNDDTPSAASGGQPGGGSAGTAGAKDETPPEAVFGDVGEDEPCESYNDCQEGLTCNREGQQQLCRDPFKDHPFCISEVVLGGSDTQGCFCSVQTGAGPQLEYGCSSDSGDFKQSGDPLCCADKTWPDAGDCFCWSQVWACGGDDTDCFCQFDRVSEGNAEVDNYQAAKCRNDHQRICCQSSFNCECADYLDSCQPNETMVPSCGAVPTEIRPTCLADQEVVTECKAGPQPPTVLPMPDPAPPKTEPGSGPSKCDPKSCHGSETSCSGDTCYFCAYACRDGACQHSCNF